MSKQRVEACFIGNKIWEFDNVYEVEFYTEYLKIKHKDLETHEDITTTIYLNNLLFIDVIKEKK